MDKFCVEALNNLGWQLTYLADAKWSDERESWIPDEPATEDEYIDMPATLRQVFITENTTKLIREIEYVATHSRARRLSHIFKVASKAVRFCHSLPARDPRIPRAAKSASKALINAAEHCWLLRERIINDSTRTDEQKRLAFQVSSSRTVSESDRRRFEFSEQQRAMTPRPTWAVIANRWQNQTDEPCDEQSMKQSCYRAKKAGA